NGCAFRPNDVVNRSRSFGLDRQRKCFRNVGYVRELSELGSIAMNLNGAPRQRPIHEGGNYAVRSHPRAIRRPQAEHNSREGALLPVGLASQVTGKFAHTIGMSRMAGM